MLKGKVIKKATREIKPYIDSLKKITMRNYGKSDNIPLMNNCCHFNATNEVQNGNAICVVECVLTDETHVTAHYICMDSNGEYYDPTLGWSWGGGDYRIVRLISANDNELWDADKMLSNLKSMLIGKCSKGTKRMIKLLKIDDGDIC